VKLTPNVKKLTILRMSNEAIPDGGGFEDGLEFLMDAKKISAGFKSAHEFIIKAIDILRNATGDHPYKNMSDEAIAGVLLSEIERKKKK